MKDSMAMTGKLRDGKRLRISSRVVGSLAAIGAAALALIRSLPVGRWVGVGALVVIAGLIALRELLVHKEEKRAAEKLRRAALRCPPMRVRESDPFSLGVTPSEIADRYRGDAERAPYISRDIDAELDKLMRVSPFVAVVGPSKAGKSRTAFEALMRVYPDHLLIAPELPSFQREGMAESIEGYLAESDGGVIIWLDDLQEFLRTRSLATQDLNAWRSQHPRVVLVATVRDGELAALRTSDDPSIDIERIIDQARLVALEPLLSKRELEAAALAYPDESFGDGIGVHLVAGPQLVERLISARGANPIGFALVAAAIDRRRAGIYEPASATELAELAPEYFQGVRPRTEFDEEEVPTALQWAAQPVIQDIGLLLRRSDAKGMPGFEPFEYVTAYRDGEVAEGAGAADIPDAIWRLLLIRHEGWKLRSVGWTAVERGQAAVAREAFEKASSDSDPHVAVHGLADLALLLKDADEDEALRLFRVVGATSYGCVAPESCYRVGLHATRHCLLDEAEYWYRRTLEFPEATVRAKALVNLGLLLRETTSVVSQRIDEGIQFIDDRRSELTEADLEREAEAQAMFEEALESNDREAVANGGNALGVLLESRGEFEAAEVALRKGADAGSEQAKLALIDMIAAQGGREAEAWKLLEELKETGMTTEQPEAYIAALSAEILEKEGHVGEAIMALRLASASRIEGLFQPATISLGRLIAESGGDANEAKVLLEEIIELDGPHADAARRRLKTIQD